MRLLICFLGALTIAGCASAPKAPPSGVLSPTCAATPVKVPDLEKFGFTPAPGKVVVVRLFRVSCPFCKEDLAHIGSLFQNGVWTKDNVQLFLMAYRKEGVEDRGSFDKFMREEMSGYGIPMEAAQVVYVDKEFYSLVKSRNADGAPIFEGWKAVPFGLVFGKDGRLAYRGHFTSSQAEEEQQYRFITGLQREVCNPDGGGEHHHH
jgi:hypothetical protein